MRFRLLGPLRVWNGSEWSSIRAPQQRVVLALLLLEAGGLVSSDRLIDEIWRDRPPPTAATVLRGYVMRLRRAIGSGTDGPLVTGNGGYRLDVDGDEIDIQRFDRLVAAGRHAMARGAPEPAARRLSEALMLCRGRPLADVPATATVAAQVARLEQARLAATEEYFGARLESGRHLDVVAALQRLVEEHPLRERLWAQLMLALDRCGRRGEALDVYQRARKVLATELGVDPGPQLRDLQQAILSAGGHPTAELPGAQRSVIQVMPNCLPADHPAFAGRGADLRHLTAVLDAAAAGRSTTPVIVVTGAAGVGKTTVGIHWAHQVADRFPDGRLFLDLRGYSPSGLPIHPTEAVRTLLAAMGLPTSAIPPSLDVAISHYRSLLANRRMIILLDNARDAEQVRPLVPHAPGSLVLVTSRNQMTGLIAANGAYPVRLDPLPAVEARRLLERRLGPERLAAEPAATDAIVGRCAGLPLALAIVAARAAIQPRFPLHELAVELGSSGLDGFVGSGDVTDIRTALSWSVRLLAPQTARLFRLLALHPGPRMSPSAVASLAGVPLRQARPMLIELSRSHLVDEPTPGRYALHDLVRAYATELVDTLDSEAERAAARRRMLDHYLRTAYAGLRLLKPDREPAARCAPQPGVAVESFANHQAALDWFAAEHPTLVAATAQAVAAGLGWHARKLSWALATYGASPNWAVPSWAVSRPGPGPAADR